jgi:hypothetical protein
MCPAGRFSESLLEENSSHEVYPFCIHEAITSEITIIKLVILLCIKPTEKFLVCNYCQKHFVSADKILVQERKLKLPNPSHIFL